MVSALIPDQSSVGADSSNAYRYKAAMVSIRSFNSTGSGLQRRRPAPSFTSTIESPATSAGFAACRNFFAQLGNLPMAIRCRPCTIPNAQAFFPANIRQLPLAQLLGHSIDLMPICIQTDRTCQKRVAPVSFTISINSANAWSSTLCALGRMMNFTGWLRASLNHIPRQRGTAHSARKQARASPWSLLQRRASGSRNRSNKGK